MIKFLCFYLWKPIRVRGMGTGTGAAVLVLCVCLCCVLCLCCCCSWCCRCCWCRGETGAGARARARAQARGTGTGTGTGLRSPRGSGRRRCGQLLQLLLLLLQQPDVPVLVGPSAGVSPRDKVGRGMRGPSAHRGNGIIPHRSSIARRPYPNCRSHRARLSRHRRDHQCVPGNGSIRARVRTCRGRRRRRPTICSRRRPSRSSQRSRFGPCRHPRL